MLVASGLLAIEEGFDEDIVETATDIAPLDTSVVSETSNVCKSNLEKLQQVQNKLDSINYCTLVSSS